MTQVQPYKEMFPSAQPLRTKRFRKLGNLLQKGGQKIGQKIERIGQKIKDFFSNLVPRQEGA